MAAPDRETRQGQDDMVDWFTVSYRSIYHRGPRGGARRRRGRVLLLDAATRPRPAAVDAAPTRDRHHRALHHARRQRQGEDGRDLRMGERGPRDGAAARAISCARARARRPRSRSSTAPSLHVRPDSLITIEESSEDPRHEAAARGRGTSPRARCNFNAPRATSAGARARVLDPDRAHDHGRGGGGRRVRAGSGESDVKLFTGTATVADQDGGPVQLAANDALKVDAAGKAGPKHDAAGGAGAAGAAAPDGDHLPGPGARHDPARLEAGAGRHRLPRDGGLQRLLQPAAGRPQRHHGAARWSCAASTWASTTGAWRRSTRTAWRAASPTSRASRSAGPRAGPAAPAIRRPSSSNRSTCGSNILQVKGRTEPGATLTVNGQRVDVASDGTFNEFIQLPPRSPAGSSWSFRAIGINGGVAEHEAAGRGGRLT